MYKIPKKTKLGGKYGTSISANFATSYVPVRNFLYDTLGARKSYTTTPFAFTDSILYQDFNIEIKRKINKKLKLNINYYNLIFEDRAVFVAKHHELIHAQIAVLDIILKLNDKHALKFEIQGLWTKFSADTIQLSNGESVLRKEDQGDWLFGQIEYTFSPHWYVAVINIIMATQFLNKDYIMHWCQLVILKVLIVSPCNMEDSVQGYFVLEEFAEQFRHQMVLHFL